MALVTAVVPTLGRGTLSDTMESLHTQTEEPEVIVLKDSRDTLVKIKEGFEQATTELVAVCDDDAVYPADWIEKLTSVFVDSTIGYAGGAVVPYIKAGSTRVEMAIGEVTSSFFGTTNMSYRQKVPISTRDADETNLVGNGVYRRSLFLRILEDYDRIPPAAWETYVLTRIKKLGFKCLSVEGVYFSHLQRTSVRGFAGQMYRCGIGRANYFKNFPGQILKKYFILFPPVFAAYLVLYGLTQLVVHLDNLAFPPVWGLWPIIAYVLLDIIATATTTRSNRLLCLLLYPVMHISYGLGMLSGLARNKRTWT